MKKMIQKVLVIGAASNAAAAVASNVSEQLCSNVGRQVVQVSDGIRKPQDLGRTPLLDTRRYGETPLVFSVVGSKRSLVGAHEFAAASAERGVHGLRLAALAGEQSAQVARAPSDQSATKSRVRGQIGDLEEVIVTAQRREEKLQDVPISLSVFTGESLESGEVTGLNSALRNVPGFAGYENTQGGMVRYSVRGVSTNPSLLNSASVVGYYMDEIPFAFVRFPVVPDGSAYDLERVEALRGPQGTLYGASSLNGVIRVVTQDANLDEFEMKARTSGSSTKDGSESYRVDAALNVPIVDGKLAARLVGGYEDEGGWIDLPNAGVKDANDRQSKNLRAKVNARPVENFGIEFMSWLSRTDRGYHSGSRDDRTSSSTYRTPFETNFDAHGLTLTYDFPIAALISSTSSMKFDSTGLADLGTLLNRTTLKADLIAQEVRLTSTSDGAWKWSLGGIYRDEEDQLIQQAFVEQTLVNFEQVQNRTVYDSQSYAFFGELTRLFFDNRVELTGGLRYFRDRNSNDEISASNIATGASVTPAGKSRTVTDDALTSRVVLSFHFTPNASLYASFGEGFRAGFSQSGFVRRNVPPEVVSVLPVVEPDKLRNYELGAKGSLMDGLLTYDLATYYIDWKDAVQVQAWFFQLGPSAQSSTFIPLNSKGIDGVGADAAVTLRWSDRWEMGATFSWNDLQFKEDVLNGPSILYPKGARPPESSKMTAGGNVSYALPLGSALSAEFSTAVNYTSRLVTAGATGLTEGDDLLRVNASITFASTSGWSVMFFGDNLTDEDGRVRPAANLILAESDRLRPRTYGLQLDYRF